VDDANQLIPGKAVAIADGVRRIVAGNAGMMTGPGTNTYLLGTGEIAVLDPGPDEPRHLDAILAAAGAPIRWIIVTHTHADHSPLASRLAELTGARVSGLPPPGDGRQDATFEPRHLPRDGERLSLGDQRPRDAFLCGSIKYKPHFQLAMSSYDGELTLSSNLYGNADDERRVASFLDEVERELAAGTTSFMSASPTSAL